MSGRIVTRFAPSPTGYLHIGGARTALFCWLLARKTGGKFVLRIEDTDVRRNTTSAMGQVIKDLRWLGIEWDEGPEVGGPNGPYLQSQRREIYDKYIKQLLDEGKAYYCFDTPEELEKMRARAVAEKRTFTYPRPKEFADESDVKKAKAEGRDVAVRFAMPEGPSCVEDEVRGSVVFSSDVIGDFIIQKSDGFPTYHFACVVDDELMGVTHIIRGQEHLMNTPGHLALQEALGFRRPIYAHMSVTVSGSGGKLSKRERPKALRKVIKERKDVNTNELAKVGGITAEEMEDFIAGKSTPDMESIDIMAKDLGVHLPEINVVDFFRSGYLPEALVNFIALLGFSPGGKREIMPVDELIDCFELSRLTKANSLFDRKKLLAFNTEHIRMAESEKLLGHFKDYLGVVESPVASGDSEKLKRLLRINAGARTLADVEKKSRFLFITNDKIGYDEKAVGKILLKGGGIGVLRILREKLAEMEKFTEGAIENMLRGLAQERAVGLGKVAQPLRVAICGTTISPPIFDSVSMLGREDTLARIDITLKKFGGGT